MYTEEEAVKKSCPNLVQVLMSRSISNPETIDALGKAGKLASAVTCQGSECMAWRWDLEGNKERAEGPKGVDERMEGYCGLAGKP
jgi:hypothetical protein